MAWVSASGASGGDGVENGIAQRGDLVPLTGVPNRTSGRDHGINEAVIIGKFRDVEAISLLAQPLDTFGQFGEPSLLPLLQAPPNGSDESDGQRIPDQGN
jgi:hypothetical protein